VQAGIWRYALKGLVLIAVITTIDHAIESTTFGKQLELASYNLLQFQLSPDEDPPVTVVDISDLQQEDVSHDGRTVRATPRDALREMIVAIVEQHPKAIGVDIDFSPDQSGLLPPDSGFFEICLQIGQVTGVPIFLGIDRTLGAPRAQWLGGERFEGLAANIRIPGDSRRMLSLIAVGGDSSRSMSLALAIAYGREPTGWVARRLTDWKLVEPVTRESPEVALALEHFLVDFSSLETLERQRLRTTNPALLRDSSQRNRFEGKLVLLGDATKATDTFLVPGRERPYAGVYLHASAAYTLIKAPLFELTHLGRLAIPVASLVAILVVIVWSRLLYANTSQTVAVRRLQGVLTLLVVVASILGGVLFVRFTRVIWSGFLLALAFLAFHPSVERLLEGAWRQVRTVAPALWRRLAVEHREEKHQ
jgi:CHASE2 domain-containing sensor protein